MADFKTYREKREAELKELKANLRLMEAKAEKARAEVKLRLQDDIKKTRKKIDETSDKLESMKKSSEEKSEELKKGFEETWKDLKFLYEKTKKNFD